MRCGLAAGRKVLGRCPARRGVPARGGGSRPVGRPPPAQAPRPTKRNGASRVSGSPVVPGVAAAPDRASGAQKPPPGLVCLASSARHQRAHCSATSDPASGASSGLTATAGSSGGTSMSAGSRSPAASRTYNPTRATQWHWIRISQLGDPASCMPTIFRPPLPREPPFSGHRGFRVLKRPTRRRAVPSAAGWPGGRVAQCEGFSQVKPSGSVSGPYSPLIVRRWEPVPSGATPASLASARRP